MNKLKSGKYYKIKKRKIFFKSRKFRLFFGIFFVILGLTYLIFFSSAFKVKRIKFIGATNYVPRLAIESKAYKEIFNPKFFYLSSNIFLLKESSLKESILKDFLSLKDVKIKKKIPDFLMLEIIERKPIANYCSKEGCYLVDDEGYIFAESDRFLVFLETEHSDKKIGDFCLEKNLWKVAQKIIAVLKEDLKIQPTKIRVFPLKIEIKTDQDWILIFSPQKDIATQSQELKAILEKQIPEEKQNHIEHIDLRYDKIFYKLKKSSR